jgi:hypothetical protein
MKPYTTIPPRSRPPITPIAIPAIAPPDILDDTSVTLLGDDIEEIEDGAEEIEDGAEELDAADWT